MERVQKWKWAAGTGVLIFLGLSFLRVAVRDVSYEKVLPGPNASSSSSKPPSAHTLVFAGLSGQPPKFIDSGPDRGLGWLEYHTQEIRKGLKQDGFEVKMEYMTPARIAHEFRSQSPICFYPTEWNNPKEFFKQRPDRIYSIPLDLGGELAQTIMFRKGDLARFQKHVDSKGDLQLESLFHDTTLKTLLIRDKDYGSLGRVLTEVNPEGEQVVRPEFQKNVMLMVVRDNRQIAEMLNGERFDYTVSDAVETEDLTRSGIDSTRFRHLNFARPSVKSKADPNLRLISISCAPNPVTLRAMPFMNRWISWNRGNDWTDLKIRYQAMLDPKVHRTFEGSESTVSSFRGEFTKGDLDDWYPNQQKYFPELRLFPVDVAGKNHPSSGAAPRSKERWTWFQEDLGVFLTSSSIPYSGEKSLRNYLLPTAFRQRALPETFLSHLSEKQRERLDSPDLFAGPQTASSFDALKTPTRMRALTLFAHRLGETDRPKLKELLFSEGLEELSVFQASPDFTREVLKALPRTLTSLDLTGSSVALSEDFPSILKGLPLRVLHLGDAQVTEPQMELLLHHLPSSLEVLSLGYNRVAWSPRNVKNLARLRLPKLWSLNLEHSFLGDSQLLEITKILGPQLKILKLGWNVFTPKSLSVLFGKPFPQLGDLDLTQSIVGGFAIDARHPYRLPTSLRHFASKFAGFSKLPLVEIIPTEKLESLDLEATPIGDDALAPLLSKLQGRLSTVNLSQTGLGQKSIAALAQNRAIQHIGSLSLSSNKLGVEEVRTLLQASFSVKNLYLDLNKITDPAVLLLAEKWVPGLIQLDLSYNPITEVGTRALSEKWGDDLDFLALKGLLSIDFSTLAQRLPKGLRHLYLDDNQVSHGDIKQLSSHLPQGLLYLGLKKAAFTEEGADALARALPSGLRQLDLERVPIGGAGLVRMTQALPSSVTGVKLGIGQLTQTEAEIVGRSLPRGLQDLWINHLSGSLASFFSNLPSSIQRLRIYNAELDLPSSRALSQRWPIALRELYFEGLNVAAGQGEHVFQTLPKTLERIAIFGAGSDGVLRDAANAAGPNMHTFELRRSSVSPGDLLALLTSFDRLKWLDLGGLDAMTSEGWLALATGKLHSLNGLTIGNNAISDRVIGKIGENLSQNLRWLSLSSTEFSPRAVKPLIAKLPKTLSRLRISGNPIGQNGLDLFREYKSKREREDGFTFDLVE